MKIANGFKSGCVTAAALCFILSANTAFATGHKAAGRLPPSVEEARGEDGREKKAGKITGVMLDAETDEVTVTVALGTLNVPKKPDPNERKEAKKPAKDNGGQKERPEIITLDGSTVTVALTDSVKVLGGMREQPQMGRNSARGDARRPAGKGNVPKHDKRRAPPRMDAGVGAKRLSVGEIVELVYGKDGKTVEEIRLLPGPRRFLPKMAQGEGAPAAGKNL